MESSMRKAMEIAYEKGYRVLENGHLIGVKGNRLVVKRRGKQRYPTFSVNVGDITKSGVYGIPVHKFASYCFYGEKTFEKGLVVRHLNGNTEDVSSENIKLGTYSENEMDKSEKVRINSARIARASQGKRPLNHRFTDDEVRYIRNSPLNGAELGRMYGVTRNCIYLIKKGVNYNDVK